jgi:hypothetical protein
MQPRLQVFLAENLEPGQSDQWDQLINQYLVEPPSASMTV